MYKRQVVLYVGKQVADVTALLPLIAGHDQAELLFGPRNGNVQQIGIIDEVGYLIVDGPRVNRFPATRQTKRTNQFGIPTHPKRLRL